MKIELAGVGKRYRLEWVLRQVTLEFNQPKRYAVTGPNGSGKSTLLRLLSGHLRPSAGKLRFIKEGRPLDPALIYPHLSYAAPYIELIEEFTLQEALFFHQRFKPFYEGLDVPKLIQLLGMQRATHKPIRHFSSGMKQRLRLALAICSQTPLLLLDEPGTNLDAQGIEWYHQLIRDFGEGRLIVVASNVEADYAFCQHILDTREWKNSLQKKN